MLASAEKLNIINKRIQKTKRENRTFSLFDIGGVGGIRTLVQTSNT